MEPLTAAAILRELVAIPTPSAVSNVPLVQWVESFLGPRGWQMQRMTYIDGSGIEKANLAARPTVSERTSPIRLAFVCHSDTVPYSSQWPDALVLREAEGYLHGCGACDVKGSLACFLAAVSSLDGQSLAPGLALILTADEEIGCKGMERLLSESALQIQAAIVSEPTSLRRGVAGKGYGLARITVEGREAHSAFPERGVSAIAIAAQLIVRIQDRFAGGWVGSGMGLLFDPPRTTVNVGVIEGGTAKNIVAGHCTFLVEWRALPEESPEYFLGELQSLLDEARQSEPRAVVHMEPLRAEAGFSPAPVGPLSKRLAALLTGEPMGISFGSEASRVARVAGEVIVIGPGDMQTAHSDRERVAVTELEQWTQTLKQLLQA